MSWLERVRGWIWKVEESSNKLEYAALDEVHKAEEAIDDRTGGRLSDALERIDEESEELLERLHLDDDVEVDEGSTDAARRQD